MKRVAFYAALAALIAAGALYLPDTAPWAPPPVAPAPEEAPAQSGDATPEAERDDDADTNAAGREAARPPPRNVTPPGIGFGPIRNIPAPETPPAPEAAPEPETRSLHRVVIEEAGAVGRGDARIRLAGIDAPGAEATCTDAAGEDWPCGRAATTALRMLVRARIVTCEMRDDGAGRCRVGDQDIGEWLVAHGWAEARDGGPYADLAEAARTEKRGMFAERWRPDAR